MARGETGHCGGGENLGEEGLTDLASGLLQVVVDGRNIGLAKMEVEMKLGGEVLDECCVGARLGTANAVVDMDYAQLQVPSGREFEQGMEQEDGIGAACT